MPRLAISAFRAVMVLSSADFSLLRLVIVAFAVVREAFAASNSDLSTLSLPTPAQVATAAPPERAATIAAHAAEDRLLPPLGNQRW